MFCGTFAGMTSFFVFFNRHPSSLGFPILIYLCIAIATGFLYVLIMRFEHALPKQFFSGYGGRIRFHRVHRVCRVPHDNGVADLGGFRRFSSCDAERHRSIQWGGSHSDDPYQCNWFPLNENFSQGHKLSRPPIGCRAELFSMWICWRDDFSTPTPFGTDSWSILVCWFICWDEFNFNSRFSCKNFGSGGNDGRLFSRTKLLWKRCWWPFRVFGFLGRHRYEVDCGFCLS